MRFKIYTFAFILSLLVTLMVRGIFFLTRYQLEMSDSQNLLLALISGFTYIAGAQLSDRLGKIFSAKNAVIFLLLIQLFMPFLCYLFHSFFPLTVFFSVFALANGMTWPFAESYASAGLDRKGASSSIGIYNICWSSALPLAMFLSGSLISQFKTGFFLIVSGGIFLSIIPVAFLPLNPSPKKEEYYKSQPDEHINSIEDLLISARWSMFFSYCILQLLNSLLPGRFYELGVSLEIAGLAAGVIDLARTTGFVYMSRTHYWHGDKFSLFVSAPAIAVGFILCMLSQKLSYIIIGELIIGLFAAVSYYSALFYAMHIKNASVDAGGAHESVIGAGFLAGPIVGLISEKLAFAQFFSSFSIHSISLFILAVFAMPGAIYPLLRKNNFTCKNSLKR